MGTLPQAFFSRKMAPIFWKPLTCGYVAQGFLFPEKNPDFLKPCAKAAKNSRPATVRCRPVDALKVSLASLAGIQMQSHDQVFSVGACDGQVCCQYFALRLQPEWLQINGEDTGDPCLGTCKWHY